MRIAIFAWESLHSVIEGGIAPHATELAAALQRRGHEVHVFTRKKGEQKDVEDFYGVTYHRVHCNAEGDLVENMCDMCNRMVWTFGETQNFVGNFDICHAHDWMTTKALVQCKNEHGKKCVFTFHSTELGRNLGPGKESISALEGEAAFISDKVIAVSGRFKIEVCDVFKLPPEKVWAINNGVQVKRFDGMIEPKEVKEKYGIGPLDPVAMFVGRMAGGMKGVDLLVEAVPGILAGWSDAKIVFVGDGDAKMHGDHRTQELGVGHACRFLGPKQGKDMVDLFKACDCVVVPSRNEPFGLVVTEAWAAGKVVVGSDQVGCPLTHGHDSWIVSCTPEGVVWGVSEVFKDFDRAKEMGKNGRVKAAFELTWDKAAEKTEECYRELLGW